MNKIRTRSRLIAQHRFFFSEFFLRERKVPKTDLNRSYKGAISRLTAKWRCGQMSSTPLVRSAPRGSDRTTMTSAAALPTYRRAGQVALLQLDLCRCAAFVAVQLDMVPLGTTKSLRISARAVVPWSHPPDLRFEPVKREVSYAKVCQVLSRQRHRFAIFLAMVASRRRNIQAMAADRGLLVHRGRVARLSRARST